MTNRKVYKHVFSLLMMMAVLVGSANIGNAYSVKKMANVADDMLNAQFWIDKIHQPNALIMDGDEINAFNKNMQVKIPSAVSDLSAAPETYTKDQLLAFADLKLPTFQFYIEGKPIGNRYWQNIGEQLNVSGIRNTTETRYGFVVRRTNQKIFPSADIISDDPADLSYDAFQNSGMLVNEPVLIVHQSLDKKWYYVIMYSCSGWVAAGDIAISPDKETWLDQQNMDEFLVVTGNKVRLEADPFDPQTSEMEFSMGTRLELADEDELPASINDRALFDNYVVKVPCRNSDGGLEYKLRLMPVSRDVRVGYLPYTSANIVRQAFKLNGDRYGWGGMLNSRDCSEFVVEVYKCFGFNLPRNTAGQEGAPTKKADLRGLSIESKYNLLENLAPGATLHFKGHVMMYLGEENGRHYVISDMGSFAEFEPNNTEAKIIRTRSVVVNDLNVMRANGNSWVQELITANQYEMTRFDDLAGYSGKAEIEGLADRFILKGRDHHTFAPESPMTRGEFSSLLSRALRLQEDSKFAEGIFADVQGMPYSGFVGALAKEGYIQGTPEGLFKPNKEILRREVSAIAARVLHKKGTDSSTEAGRLSMENLAKILNASAASHEAVTRYEAALVISEILKH